MLRVERNILSEESQNQSIENQVIVQGHRIEAAGAAPVPAITNANKQLENDLLTRDRAQPAPGPKIRMVSNEGSPEYADAAKEQGPADFMGPKRKVGFQRKVPKDPGMAGDFVEMLSHVGNPT